MALEVNKKSLKKGTKKRISQKNGNIIDEDLVMKYMGKRLLDQKSKDKKQTSGHEIKFSGLADQKKSNKTQSMISDFNSSINAFEKYCDQSPLSRFLDVDQTPGNYSVGLLFPLTPKDFP